MSTSFQNRRSRVAQPAVPPKPKTLSRPIRRWLELLLEADKAVLREDTAAESRINKEAKAIFQSLPEQKQKALVAVAQLLELELENAGHDDDAAEPADKEDPEETDALDAVEQQIESEQRPAKEIAAPRPASPAKLEVIQELEGLVPRQLCRDQNNFVSVFVNGAPALIFPPNTDPGFIRRVFAAMDQLI